MWTGCDWYKVAAHPRNTIAPEHAAVKAVERSTKNSICFTHSHFLGTLLKEARVVADAIPVCIAATAEFTMENRAKLHRARSSSATNLQAYTRSKQPEI